MITIDNTAFTSGISFSDILAVQTKAELLQICKKLDLYVSPNLKKDETVHRVAATMMTNPINILSVLNKQELLIVNSLLFRSGPARSQAPVTQTIEDDGRHARLMDEGEENGAAFGEGRDE